MHRLFALISFGLAQFAFAQPNIVVIMTDDLDVGSLKTMVDAGMMPHLKTYVIDRGITFSQSFVTDSVCCPSRATFLTGQYAHNHGTISNEPPTGGVMQFRDASTLAVWLKNAGYRTGLVGKYLNGYGIADVNRDGTLDIRDAQYVPPGWDDWQVLIDPYTGRIYQYIINDNGQLVGHGSAAADYQTDVLALRAARFVFDADRLNDAKPFFLTVMPTAPHQEVWPGLPVGNYSDAWTWTIRPAPRHVGTVNFPLPQKPSFSEPDVLDKPSWLRLRPALTATDVTNLTAQYRDRLGSLRAVDDLVGTIVAALANTGELQNTVIIFTSDNGFFYGEHRLPQKMAAYEEAISVPLHVVIPGLPGGRTSDRVVINNDLAPTIAQLAGATPGLQIDGRSFVPLLIQPAAPWRQRFLVEHWIANPLSIFDIPTYIALRTARTDLITANQLYVEYSGPPIETEFYDMNSDAYQLASLHGDNSPMRAFQRSALKQWMTALMTCVGTGCQSLEFHGAR